jgi:hypothetical protein
MFILQLFSCVPISIASVVLTFFFIRLECLKLIQNGLADFAPFEPEDMYIAAKFMDDSLAIFLEMRNAITQLGIHAARTTSVINVVKVM